jgi:hypothetical protein
MTNLCHFSSVELTKSSGNASRENSGLERATILYIFQNVYRSGKLGRGASNTVRNFATFQALSTTPALHESVVAVAILNNDEVRIQLGHFCTARMHVVVEPCCSTSNNSLMQRNQLIKLSEILGLPSLRSDLWSEKF